MAKVELSFTALPAHVRTARLVAAAVARRSGVDEAVACANDNEYGLAAAVFGRDQPRIDMHAALQDREIMIPAAEGLTAAFHNA